MYVTSSNWSCRAKHLPQPSLFLSAATTHPLACRLMHARDHLLKRILEPMETMASCTWGKGKGPQPRSAPRANNRDRTHGRSVLAGRARDSAGCNVSLLVIYQFGSPLKNPNDQDNLSSTDVVLRFIKCCKTAVNTPSKFCNNQSIICSRTA